MNQTTSLIVLLAALCFCSSIAVVYSRHLSIEGYGELSLNQQIIDSLDVQWSQLQIEESTFSEYGLVERTAKDRLDMSFPGLEGSFMIVR